MFRKKQEQKPTHWQLPTYDGTKSYQNLLVGVYGMVIGSLSGSHLDAKVHNDPINFIRSGYCEHTVGTCNESIKYRGFYWSRNQYANTASWFLDYTSTSLGLSAGTKGNGFTIRCLVR